MLPIRREFTIDCDVKFLLFKSAVEVKSLHLYFYALSVSQFFHHEWIFYPRQMLILMSHILDVT